MDYVQEALQSLDQAQRHSGEAKIEDYPLTMAVIGLGYAYLAAHEHQVKLAQFDELAYQQLMNEQSKVDGPALIERAKEMYQFLDRTGPAWDDLPDVQRHMWWQAVHIARSGQPSSTAQ